MCVTEYEGRGFALRSCCILFLVLLIVCGGCSNSSNTSPLPKTLETSPVTLLSKGADKDSKSEPDATRQTVSHRKKSERTKSKRRSHAEESYHALSALRHKYPGIFKNSGSSYSRRVSLTFDDVPDEFTGKVLDVLKEYNVKATFFVMGYRAEKHPDLIKRMVREGHLIGNHTYNHPLLTKLSMVKFKQQILRTDAILHRIIGYHPKFIRPPYGEINEQQVRWAGNQGYIIVNWNVDSQDWRGLSAQRVMSNILTTTRPGSIILQHAAGNVGGVLNGTLEALPRVIERLKSQRYQFVTLTDMFHVRKSSS